MNFWRDNFAHPNPSLWEDVTSECTITLSGGRKKYDKTATGWDNGGSRIVPAKNRVLQAGDTIHLVCVPKTYTVGGTPETANSTFWQAGFQVDNDDFSQSQYGYGIYLEGDGFKSTHSDGRIQTVPVTAGETYHLVYQIQADSSIAVYAGIQPNIVPLGIIAGPFLNRSGGFYVNIYSVDKVDLLDFVGHDISGV